MGSSNEFFSIFEYAFIFGIGSEIETGIGFTVEVMIGSMTGVGLEMMTESFSRYGSKSATGVITELESCMDSKIILELESGAVEATTGAKSEKVTEIIPGLESEVAEVAFGVIAELESEVVEVTTGTESGKMAEIIPGLKLDTDGITGSDPMMGLVLTGIPGMEIGFEMKMHWDGGTHIPLKFLKNPFLQMHPLLQLDMHSILTLKFVQSF